MHFNLTSTQKEFLKILDCFIHDQSCELSEDFSAFQDLYSMAAIHRVTAPVFEVICRDQKLKSEENRELYANWKQCSIREVSRQTQKTFQFLVLYQQLCEVGVRPLVVKGIIRRQMYSKPDYCSSSDEDLLIRKEDFGKCDKLLLAQGFKRQDVDLKNLPMEVSYLHPITSVYLEVHMALFPEQLGVYGDLNRGFTQAFDTAIVEIIQGVSVWTLEPTLHMWYLICHSLKHFLHSGYGLRQVCDMVKMAEYYGEQIRWDEIGRKIKTMKLERYWGGIVDIAQKYFQLELKGFKRYDGSALLLDLFDSGIYGSSSLARRQSSNMTLTAAKRGKKSTFASLWRSLFPGKAYLKSKYSYLKEHPWMLPKAWAQRFKGYLRAQKRKAAQQKSIKIGMQRVELLKKYGLISE